MVRPVEVYDTETQDLLGRVVDVSESGMMLVGDKPHDSDAGPRRLRMVLPKHADAPEVVELEAECRWSNDAEQEQYSGFEFVSDADDVKDTLDLVVDQLAGGGFFADDE